MASPYLCSASACQACVSIVFVCGSWYFNLFQDWMCERQPKETVFRRLSPTPWQSLLPKVLSTASAHRAAVLLHFEDCDASTVLRQLIRLLF